MIKAQQTLSRSAIIPGTVPTTTQQQTTPILRGELREAVAVNLTPAGYKALRETRGSQVQVTGPLGIALSTLSRRERLGPVTKEAWLAMASLPRLVK